jgi:purine-nucleoside phosphorylase
MATPHNNAEVGDIAKTVVIAGDPKRAKLIAESFFDEGSIKVFNEVRGIYGATGTYKGKKMSVMAHGMGIPSISIYVTELFKFYGVENVIRVGSAGALKAEIELGQVLFATSSSTDSNFAKQFGLNGTFSAAPDFSLLRKAANIADEIGKKFIAGPVLCSDTFYDESGAALKWAKELNLIGVEMESYALYTLAAHYGKKALAIFTVSDSVVTGEATSAEQRQNDFTDMMKIGLETAYSLED